MQKHSVIDNATEISTYPPLSGGITAISSVGCREMMVESERSIYSLFSANNMLYCIGRSLKTQLHRSSSLSLSSAAAKAQVKRYGSG